MLVSKVWPALYKKNKDGSIQEWIISVREEDGEVYIQKHFGRIGGTLQSSDPDIITEGKNIGKANETTPMQQAHKEAEAQWLKKKKGGKGYVESIKDAALGKKDAIIEGGIDPMLAHVYAVVIEDKVNPDNEPKIGMGSKSKHIEFPVIVQPKLDGSRCIAQVVDGTCTLWSRTRKPIMSVPHIIEQVESMCAEAGIQDITLDGELYNHDYHNNFEELMHLIKTNEPNADSHLIEYHIYDYVSPEPMNERIINVLDRLTDLIKEMSEPMSNIAFVESSSCFSHDELIDKLDVHIDRGYEGIILRNAYAGYTHDRSNDLQKLKKFYDAEFTITGIKEGRGRMAGKAIFECQAPMADPTDDRFDVKMKGSLEELERIFNDDPANYIGKPLTVRYQGLTSYGKPRFPVGHSIRDYE